MTLSTVSMFTPIQLWGTAVKLQNYARWTRLWSTTHLFSASFESRLSSNFWNSSSIFHCTHLQFSHCKYLGAWARIILFHIKLQKTFFQKHHIQKRPKKKNKFVIAFTLVAKTAFKSVFHFFKYPNIQVNH